MLKIQLKKDDVDFQTRRPQWLPTGSPPRPPAGRNLFRLVDSCGRCLTDTLAMIACRARHRVSVSPLSAWFGSRCSNTTGTSMQSLNSVNRTQHHERKNNEFVNKLHFQNVHNFLHILVGTGICGTTKPSTTSSTYCSHDHSTNVRTLWIREDLTSSHYGNIHYLVAALDLWSSHGTTTGTSTTMSVC